jgi:hypothetical protein
MIRIIRLLDGPSTVPCDGPLLWLIVYYTV